MTDDWLEARYEKDPNIVYREIAGEAILVPIRKHLADMEAIYTLNETGVFVWRLFDGQRTLGDIRDLVLYEYDTVPDQVARDLRELTEELTSIGAIKAVPL